MPDDCILCQIIDGKVPSKKVYEDDNIVAVLDVNGSSPGHCFLMPKKHFTILEQIPDPLVGELFSVANKISTAIFEALNIQGTNIFVENGVSAGQNVAHFMIQVVPRNDNDGINLQWQPRQLNEEEMSTVELKLKEEAQNVGSFEKPEKKKQKEDEPIDGEDNYLLKSLTRIP